MPKHLTRLTLFLPILLALTSCFQSAIETPVVESTAQSTAIPEFIPTVPAGAREMIIFSMEEDGYAHLFTYIPNQQPLTRLTGDKWDDITPAVSPDGKKIAFASNRSGFWDLYILDATTGEVTQITNTPEYEGAPTWSPDGSFLAFEAYLNDNLEIVIGPAENPRQDAVLLTSSPASDHSPSWAPGGRHITFISDGEVILANLDKDRKSVV